MNFFKLYIGDYQRDTGHLSIAEHGAYVLMLQHYYATEKPLPVGRALYRLLRSESKAERDAIDYIASQFWRETDSGLVNDRAMIEIEKASHQRAVNQELGKRGGRPKKSESKTESVIDSDSQQEPNDNPNQTPDTRVNQTPQTPRKRGASDRGIQFKTFLADCKVKGEKAISAYKPVFDFAEQAHLPDDFVQLAWFEFGRQFGDGGVKETKTQKDWRKTFRNYVEKNYLKLWWVNPDGKYELTTLGRQAQSANAERLAA
jgi:uncharacterized protein YdaU (DUF1376 family)